MKTVAVGPAVTVPKIPDAFAALDDRPHAMSESTEPTTNARAAGLPVARRERVLSGMRPTGALHLGHYHGALKNWVRLQADYECFYFVADWHALTTHYEERGIIEKNVYDMVIDWLAAGIDPDNATIFIQSRLPEHAELFTLLAMGTPLGWLERVPTYKDQIEQLRSPGVVELVAPHPHVDLKPLVVPDASAPSSRGRWRRREPGRDRGGTRGYSPAHIPRARSGGRP